MQTQQAMTLRRTLIAVVATVVAALFAVALVLDVERPAASVTTDYVTLHAVGAEQIGHNRSEEGLGGSASVGGQQVAHNRSEEGFSKP